MYIEKFKHKNAKSLANKWIDLNCILYFKWIHTFQMDTSNGVVHAYKD